MPFLPIVSRELRVAARRRSTYFTRLAAVLIAIVIGGFLSISMHQASAAPYLLGKSLFATLSVLSFIYCMGVGVLVTSDCLSIEKREGTLGLLFLTDLRGYDVVFGKLVATSLNAFYAMLAIFPVLAVPLLLGGVTATEFWRVMLVCVNLMFFSLTAGMFASAVCREERKAMGLTLLIIIGISALPPLLGVYFFARNNWSTYPGGFVIPSPFFDCVLAFSPKLPNLPANAYAWKLALTHTYGWLFIVISCVLVPRSWQESSARAKAGGWRALVKWAADGTAEKRLELRRRFLDINAFFWLATRGRGKVIAMWSFLAILAIAWFWCWAVFGKDWLNKFNYVTTAIVLHGILKYNMATEACRRFVEDRRSGALELLLSTPLTVHEILRGQRLALMRVFGAPMVTIVIVDLLFLVAGFNERNSYSTRDEIFWGVFCLVGITVFVFDMIAMAWVGMWLGMKSRGANRAAAGNWARIVVLRWLVFAFSLMIFAWLSLFRSTSNEEYIFTLYWFAIAVGLNIFFMMMAKSRVHANFRDIATQRFEFKLPKPAKGSNVAPPVIAR